MVMSNEEYKAIRSHNRDHYGLGFFKFTDEDHGPANLKLGEVLWELFKPASAVDFGCGTGGTLSSLLARGATVLGVEGFSACLPLIERRDPQLVQHIQIHDLTTPWKCQRAGRFDLAISMEFLEHIGPEAADTAVHTIASAAPRALVTAAPPSGGNSLHLNEQPFTYWVEKFDSEGFNYNPVETNALRDVMRKLAYEWIDSNKQKGCLIPAWMFSSYLGIFTKR